MQRREEWMSWFRKAIRPLTLRRPREVPDGSWLKCAGCGEILYRQELERSLWVCARCGAHFRISGKKYIEILCDEGSFESLFWETCSLDPLKFRDAREKYDQKLKRARKGDPHREAITTGRARIAGSPVALGVMDFSFLGGSMGSVVGERIARVTDLAMREGLPLVIVSSSGGARMQEGILSLMQMAKTCAQLARLHDAGLPFISILTDPTTGGVSASFAALGDVIIAEPKALIGFAGPRVIRETIGQELPSGFQRAEFLLEHGFVDLIIPRGEIRSTLGLVLRHFVDGMRPGGVDAAGLSEAGGSNRGGSPAPE
jgi:acetyl-CoA carboxylase carboxyl transferase subunit beta